MSHSKGWQKVWRDGEGLVVQGWKFFYRDDPKPWFQYPEGWFSREQEIKEKDLK